MSYEAIARRWARAIFEIGKESGSLAELTRDIGQFADSYASNQELALVLGNPLVPEAARETILRDIADKMGVSDTTKRVLLLLSRKRRLGALPDVARRLAQLADEDGNLLRAEVTSAGPLSEAYLGKLKSELEKATGKKVVISQRQDRSLIGGVVTRIGDRVIDGSVRARLATFRDSLLRSS